MNLDVDLQIAKSRLMKNGYTLIPRVFDSSYICALNDHCEQLLQDRQGADVLRHGRLGHLIDMTYQTRMLRGLCLSKTLWIIYEHLGFTDPRLWKGYLVSKEPTAPSTYWHQDWQFWSNPISYGPVQHQVFVMIYLIDTRPSNGCLRVIPGSHQARHRLHYNLGRGHADPGVISGDSSYQHLFDQYSSETDVLVEKGDIVVGDARLLHAVHANCEGARRNLIVFDLLTQFSSLPPGIQNAAAETALRPAEPLSDHIVQQLQRILPARHPTSEELEPLNRTPSFPDGALKSALGTPE